MTISEAIAEVDHLKPNMYGEKEKVRWLSRLDTRIQRDILDTHETSEDDGLPEFDGYTDDTSGDTVLLAKEPYDEMYVHWLSAQIDYANRELESFNSSNAMFESVFASFRNYWNRTHMPKSAEKTFY